MVPLSSTKLQGSLELTLFKLICGFVERQSIVLIYAEIQVIQKGLNHLYCT